MQVGKRENSTEGRDFPDFEWEVGLTASAAPRRDSKGVRTTLAAAIALLGFPSGAVGQSLARVKAASVRVTGLTVTSDSRLWLEGSSNVRDWTCRATRLDATFDLEAGGETRLLRAVSVTVPVRTLKCGDRHMEAHMYTALKAPPLPAISMITARFEQMPRINQAGEKIETSGKVTIAGVERAVTMSAISE